MAPQLAVVASSPRSLALSSLLWTACDAGLQGGNDEVEVPIDDDVYIASSKANDEHLASLHSA